MAGSGQLLLEEKEVQGYKAPSLAELIIKSKKIRSEYQGKNISRLELISLLEIVHESIEKTKVTQPLTETQLQSICIGCWIFCLEKIARHYKVLNPAFEIGSFFNSGSKLYQLILNDLNLSKSNQINEQKKLDYLNQFYKYVNKEETLKIFEEKRLRINIKENLIKAMQNVLHRENNTAKRVLKAIPCEKAMDQKIANLHQEYKRQATKQNPSRLFLINLATAISKDNPTLNDKLELATYYISRSQRIKMGSILYIMQSIADTYRFHLLRSPRDHSILYQLCDDQILVGCFKYLNNQTKLACYSAFLSYINDFRNRKKLEERINKQYANNLMSMHSIYIDQEMNTIANDLNRMIKKLKPQSPSNVTLAMTGLGALVGAAPGYGTGYGIGYGCSLTDQSDQFKQKLSNFTRYAMLVLFESGSYFGYYTADIVVNATLERFYAKIFEALGSLLCAAGFGATSFIIYDLSYETARNLCQLYLHLCKNVDPTLLSQTDLRFVSTLLDLPENVFSYTKKEKLRNITYMATKDSTLGFLSSDFTESQLKIIPTKEKKHETEENSVPIIMKK